MKEDQFAEMVEQAKNQDGEAITHLYEEFHNGVYFLCMKIVKNEDDALDLVQDSFLQAFGKLDTLQNPAQFGSWLNQIAANKCRDYLKKKKPALFSQRQSGDDEDEQEEPDIEDRDESLIPDKALDTEETRRLIMGIIDGLPDLQRMTVMLYYYEEKSVREIAEIMECSENTVKSRLNYARKQIREGVLDLEKKGTKLYGVMPLLFPLIRHAAADVAIPSKASASILESITSFPSGSPAQSAAGTASAKPGHGAAFHIAAKTSSTVRKAAAGFSKLSLPMKIGVGTASVAVAVGIGMGVSATIRHSALAQVPTDSSQTSSSEAFSTANSKASSALSSSVPSPLVSSAPEVIPVTGISLSKTKISLTVGQETMPVVTMSPKDATDKGKIWSSSDAKVATVDKAGNIRAVGIGSCTVTVTAASDQSISTRVSVNVGRAPHPTELNSGTDTTKQSDLVENIKSTPPSSDGGNSEASTLYANQSSNNPAMENQSDSVGVTESALPTPANN